ncbi:pPIWI_RE module domain-containing protein [Micromonospora sp. LOL_024]|uniref:pPIWI_RE module domain-containing protein n=1 Tax=Micromonospora sp. LOL_024 TaxID=3345412 RepID=UPI003A88D9D8
MRLDPAYPIEREYYAMRFPQRWLEPLQRLAKTVGGDIARNFIASLNDVITATVPECVVTQRYAGPSDDHDQYWLLAYQPVSVATIFNLVAAWVRTWTATLEQPEQALSHLSPDDLIWSPVRIGPELPMSHLTRLIPMEVAATLSRHRAPHGDLVFVPCPTETGAELISWPPERIEERTPFSVTIGVTAQTTPTSNELLVYLSLGVRRWAPMRGKLAVGRRYPVYLAPSASFPSRPTAPYLGRADITLARVLQEDGRHTWLPRWDDALTRVLDQMGYPNLLPDPNLLVNEPVESLRRTDASAALTYVNGMLPWPRVSEGLSVADRHPLMSWIVNELSPHMRPVEPLTRAGRTIYKGLAGAATDVITPEVLCDAIGPRLTVELLTESEETAQYALDRLEERLGAPFPRAEKLNEVEVLRTVGPMTIGVRRLILQRRVVTYSGSSRLR